EPRVTGDHDLVQELAALLRFATHQGEILRGEQGGADDAQQLAGGGQLRAVDVSAVGSVAANRDVGGELPVVVHRRGGDPRDLLALPDQRGIGVDPVGTQVGQVAQGLDDVGLAVPVGTGEHRDTR